MNELEEHLVEVAHCDILLGYLDAARPRGPSTKVVLAQWEERGGKENPHEQRTTEERLEHWRRFHQLPEPWNGYLDKAPLLFVSSNPSIIGTLPKDLSKARSKPHWTTCETGERMVIERVQSTRIDGQKETYWMRIHRRAEELFVGKEIIAGEDYAITEAVRCKSLGAAGVHKAFPTCTRTCLGKTIELSAAKVIVGVGAHARRALPKVLPLSEEPKVGRLEEVRFKGRELLVAFLPHPSAPSASFFSTTHTTPGDIERLQAALLA